MSTDSTAVATTDNNSEPVADLATILGNDQLANASQEEVFSTLATSIKFLPRIQLFGSNSDMCKMGKIPIAHYGLVKSKDKLIDLGKNVPCFVLAWRAKAMLIKNEEVKSYFNPKSPEFLALRELTQVQDSGAMVGPEFLVFIPGHGFALFFMATKTALNEADNVKAMIGKPATLTAKFIQTKKYSWHGPEINQSSVPIDPPDPTQLVQVLTEFRNPKDTVDEVDNNGATPAANQAAAVAR